MRALSLAVYRQIRIARSNWCRKRTKVQAVNAACDFESVLVAQHAMRPKYATFHLVDDLPQLLRRQEGATHHTQAACVVWPSVCRPWTCVRCPLHPEPHGVCTRNSPRPVCTKEPVEVSMLCAKWTRIAPHRQQVEPRHTDSRPVLPLSSSVVPAPSFLLAAWATGLHAGRGAVEEAGYQAGGRTPSQTRPRGHVRCGRCVADALRRVKTDLHW